MLIKTGRGSISFVAGCCWVNSVTQPPPAKHSLHGQRDHRKPQLPDPASEHGQAR